MRCGGASILPHSQFRLRLRSDAIALSTTLQGKFAEAGSLYERAQAIEEKVLGPEHPDLATTLHNRAGLLQAKVRVGKNFS